MARRSCGRVSGARSEDIDVLFSHNEDMTFVAIEVKQDAGIERARISP